MRDYIDFCYVACYNENVNAFEGCGSYTILYSGAAEQWRNVSLRDYWEDIHMEIGGTYNVIYNYQGN